MSRCLVAPEGPLGCTYYLSSGRATWQKVLAINKIEFLAVLTWMWAWIKKTHAVQNSPARTAWLKMRRLPEMVEK